MTQHLIYRRPVAGRALKPLLSEFSTTELRAFVGEAMAERLMAGEPVPVGDYTAVDLIAFYEACCEDRALPSCIRVAETEGAAP